MTRNHIVSVDIVSLGGKDTVITTPDSVHLLVGDSVQWFSKDGPQQGHIIDGKPFKDIQTWQAAQNVPSKPLTAATTGRFKYSIKVLKNGQLPGVEADPEVVVS
jgi:hypothetical protein